MGVRTVVAEPDPVKPGWRGQRAEQQAVYANRRRLRGPSGGAWLPKRDGHLTPRRACCNQNSCGSSKWKTRIAKGISGREGVSG